MFGFDFGPSNYAFDLPLADHRRNETKTGEILTELAHPLYQLLHQYVLEIVQKEYDVSAQSLWPNPVAKTNRDFLTDAACAARFSEITIREYLSPLSGFRVLEFMRNGWTVFFRWGELSKLPIETKLNIMERALDEVYKHRDFEDMCAVQCYHPTAVVTVKKS